MRRTFGLSYHFLNSRLTDVSLLTLKVALGPGSDFRFLGLERDAVLVRFLEEGLGVELVDRA